MPIERNDAERTLVISSLEATGPAKPVGYLPLYTIRDLLKLKPERLAAEAVMRGLSAKVFGPDECRIKSGALFVYHREALSCLLSAQVDVLKESGLPHDPDSFIAHIATNWLEPGHPAYPIVPAAFAQKA